jgi:putative ATPase
MTSLFQAAGMGKDAPRPLADRLRPQKLADVVGQDHLVGPDGVITRMLAAGRIPSVILWGPPGTGKTTIARLLAGETGLAFEQISAIFSGVADLKKVFEQARIRREQGRGTLLFVDEIHRFNKSQQDSFLPYVEDGTIILVGATTENPELRAEWRASLPRAGAGAEPARHEAMQALIRRAEIFERRPLPADAAARDAMIGMADGDGRYFLNMLEEVFAAVPEGGSARHGGAGPHGAEAHAAL